jgi:hypothetical protein
MAKPTKEDKKAKKAAGAGARLQRQIQHQREIYAKLEGFLNDGMHTEDADELTASLADHAAIIEKKLAKLAVQQAEEAEDDSE